MAAPDSERASFAMLHDLRLFRTTDAEKVRNYYENEPNAEHIRIRPKDVVKAAVDIGQVWTMENAAGSIVGVGCRFDYNNSQYLEVGGDVVSKSVGGYRLQKMLIAIRLIEMVLLDPESKVFAVVSRANPYHKDSMDSLQANGFTPFKPPTNLIEARDDALKVASDLEGSDYLEHVVTNERRATLKEHFQHFINRTVQNRNGNDLAQLDLEDRFFSDPDVLAAIETF